MRKGFAVPVPVPPRARKQQTGNGLTGAERARMRATETRLLLSAQSGDAQALRRLLELAAAPAWRFSRGFCRDPDDAEDLVQDVLITLMRTLKSFRGESSLSTWTYTVARRACARRRRRTQRHIESSSSAARSIERQAHPGPTPEQVLDRRELAAAIESAVASLPVGQRSVVVMRDVEGLSAADVAEVLGIGERAVKSRLHRARLTLRSLLAPFVAGGAVPSPMAACPDTARLLSRYLEGEVDAATCARMEAHVHGCASCAAACQSLRKVLGACRAYGTARVPVEVRAAVHRAVERVLPPPREG